MPEAIGLTDKLNDMPFARQPVQKRGCHDIITNNTVPYEEINDPRFHWAEDTEAVNHLPECLTPRSVEP